MLVDTTLPLDGSRYRVESETERYIRAIDEPVDECRIPGGECLVYNLVNRAEDIPSA